MYLTLFISGCVTVPRQPAVQPYGIYHIVARGQTLYRIAKTYKIDVNELIRTNKIIDPTQVGIGQKLFIPGARFPLAIEPFKPISQEAVKKLIGPRYPTSHWRYITLHHSATFEGNAASFDRHHRDRKLGGLFYHFVIGNGTLSGDGEIEVGWRWREQKEVNRTADIQICLVGNFSKEVLNKTQLDGLVKLINVLRKQYNIPLGNIRKHQDVVDKFTECPGSNFPFSRLLQELKKS